MNGVCKFGKFISLKNNFKTPTKFFNSSIYDIPRKIKGFEEPTIWYKFSRLAMVTNSVNLGQGFPDWNTPEFVLESLTKHVTDPKANHQYTRSFGNLKLADSVAKKYSKIFDRKINSLNEILISNGAVNILYNVITGLVREGDEVIVLEPFYDCYLPQAKFSGGKVIGVPMIPPDFIEKPKLENLTTHKIIKNDWKIDLEKLEKSFTDKTRLLILNTPNNPTGKILSYQELNEIAKIVKKYSNVVVVVDEVYEHMIFDLYTELPRMANVEGMWDRTISIMSPGKFFSATGIRIGWCIGPQKLLQIVNTIHQYNSFCLYDPAQLAISDSLEIAEQPYKGFPNYYLWLRNHYLESRNYFVNNLSKLKSFDSNFYLPEGGYFVIADISNKKNEVKYSFEGEEIEKNNYSKDFNYLLNLAHEKHIVGIPCSPFYTSQNKSSGERFIRLAFCKKKETMDKAFEHFNKF